MADLKRGADFFEKGTWGLAFRDQVNLMTEAIDGMEQGKLKTVPQMEAFFKTGFERLRKQHEERAAALQEK